MYQFILSPVYADRFDSYSSHKNHYTDRNCKPDTIIDYIILNPVATTKSKASYDTSYYYK